MHSSDCIAEQNETFQIEEVANCEAIFNNKQSITQNYASATSS
jgi:hypothetical protein